MSDPDFSKSKSPEPARETTISGPLISEQYLAISTQRLYYLSFGLLCQAIKVFSFVFTKDTSPANYQKWLGFDFAYCIILALLRLPGLNYNKLTILLQIGLLWAMNGAMIWSTNSSYPTNVEAASLSFSKSTPSGTPLYWNILDYVAPYVLGYLGSSSHEAKDIHLLGQHTIRMSPINTAQLNPDGSSFCLASPGNPVFIPVLLSNVKLAGLRYSVTPLAHVDDGYDKAEYFDLNPKDLKNTEYIRTERLRRRLSSLLTSRDSGYDDKAHTTHSLKPTQSLVHILLSRPGTVRIERVLDTSNIDSRIIYPFETTVVPCPRAEFLDLGSSEEEIRCSGIEPDLKLMVDIYGVPPLSLGWSKTINGKREYHSIHGMEGGDHKYDRQRRHHLESAIDSEPFNGKASSKAAGLPQELRTPLVVPMDIAGDYLYVLEEVTDAIGNTVHLGSNLITTDMNSMSKTKTTRSLTVLRRPIASFRHCSTESPMSLLMGKGAEAILTVSSNASETFDGNWEVLMKYQPPTELEYNARGNKRLLPWERPFRSQGNRRDISISATAPGDYTIIQVKGKRCIGEIAAPHTCTVVEKPLPTAQIEWKPIYECSGEIGVSASVTVHGTPPFRITYRVQRENEQPREFTKSFATTHDEIFLQPTRSGQYTYTFVQIGDANYAKEELSGPTINQLIHPFADADFISGQIIPGAQRRILHTCETGSVLVDVELQGIGPWDLEIRITSDGRAETLQIPNIETSRKTLELPIPEVIDRNGGTFEIDLVSVEDARKCKQTISVPGLTIAARKTKPTAWFHGEKDQRSITVLEQERVTLPLRFTGDGPWRIKYRRAEVAHLNITATFTTPISFLHVTEKGTYTIMEVEDSQCPGSVVTDASTYDVAWLPRPTAMLSPQAIVSYETHNGSHVLRSVCEGMNDYIDIGLTGRPPFQLTYSIAQKTNTGGAKLLYQPTFNSMEPRSRFQLQTSQSGHVFYEITQIGDAVYPLAKYKSGTISPSGRLLFEQQVSVRPSARFKTKDRLSYYLNDVFVPLNPRSEEGAIILEGIPPFRLQLSIKTLATRQVDTMTIDVPTAIWKIDLPSYSFKSVGPHLISIEAVFDASNCPHATLDPSSNSVWVDVAAGATIVPLDSRINFCVGDVAHFHLEGMPPWSIGYRINGKSYTKEVKTPDFSILQERPGDFIINSIAHQQEPRKPLVPNLHFMVYPIPSALIAQGKKIYQDINEGDQAEIVFTLIGEPPFTFTYQRSELNAKGHDSDKPGKVIETQTVSHVQENTYSIFASMEGTWRVTSISDAYCQYPHSQADLNA